MTARNPRNACIALASCALAFPGIIIPASSLGTAGRSNVLSPSSPKAARPRSRPLLREFGESIAVRVRDSKHGHNRVGLEEHFSSGACDNSAEDEGSLGPSQQ